jgi:hypothetical protein
MVPEKIAASRNEGIFHAAHLKGTLQAPGNVGGVIGACSIRFAAALDVVNTNRL